MFLICLQKCLLVCSWILCFLKFFLYWSYINIFKICWKYRQWYGSNMICKYITVVIDNFSSNIRILKSLLYKPWSFCSFNSFIKRNVLKTEGIFFMVFQYTNHNREFLNLPIILKTGSPIWSASVRSSWPKDMFIFFTIFEKKALNVSATSRLIK